MSQDTKSGLWGAWVTWVIWCFAKKLRMRRDAWADVVSWWSFRSPVAHSCGLLNHPNSFHGGTFKLKTKFDADLLPYWLSHFECDGHTVHMLTQGHLPPPLTSTVKSSLFTHAHSSPLSLVARLHWCHTNHSCYIKSGWAFPGQTHVYSFYACKSSHSSTSWQPWKCRKLVLKLTQKSGGSCKCSITRMHYLLRQLGNASQTGGTHSYISLVVTEWPRFPVIHVFRNIVLLFEMS